MVMARSRLFRHTSVLLVLSLLVLTAGRANAQTYPSNKITLIVAFAAGGVADTLARMVGQGLSERLHQNVVVENRGGAGGNIAAGVVAHAARRRIHAARDDDCACHQRNLAGDQAVLGGGFQNRRDRRIEPRSAGDKPKQSRQESRGIRQGRTRQDHQFRLGRCRQRVAHRGRILLQENREDRRNARAVPGRRAGDQRDARKPNRPACNDARRRRRRADRERQAQGSRRREKTRLGDA